MPPVVATPSREAAPSPPPPSVPAGSAEDPEYEAVTGMALERPAETPVAGAGPGRVPEAGRAPLPAPRTTGEAIVGPFAFGARRGRAGGPEGGREAGREPVDAGRPLVVRTATAGACE